MARANRNVTTHSTLQIAMPNNMPATPPHGPLGMKNSASSRPVEYPPPMTTALKAKPGNRMRLNHDARAVREESIAVVPTEPPNTNSCRVRKSQQVYDLPPGK